MRAKFERIGLDADHLMFINKTYADKNFDGYYHYHQCCEFLFVHQGQGRIIVNQRTYNMEAGMVFYFQPFQLHRVHADVSENHPYERSILKLNPAVFERSLKSYPQLQHFFNTLWKGQLHHQAFNMSDRQTALDYILKSFSHSAIYEQNQALVEKRQLFFAILLSEIYEHEKTGDQTISHKRKQHHSEAIMQWIEEHYMDPFQLEKLAKDLHLSKSYVSRVFRQETGSSVSEYLTARRIEEACRILETTDLPIEVVGMQVGLPNASYFSQLFKKVTNQSPLQYRKQQYDNKFMN